MCSAVLLYCAVVCLAVYVFFFFQCQCFLTVEQFFISFAEIASFNVLGIV